MKFKIVELSHSDLKSFFYYPLSWFRISWDNENGKLIKEQNSKYGEITKEGKLYVPRWLVIIMFFICIIPWANIFEFVAFWINYAVNTSPLTTDYEKELFKHENEYKLWKFEDDFLSKPI